MPSLRQRNRPPTALLLVLLTGCASINLSVPPVATVAPAADAEMRAQLEQGRAIYLTKCARCHAPEPVREYSAKQWKVILEKMSPNCLLNTTEAAALQAYVAAAVAQVQPVTNPTASREPAAVGKKERP